MPKWEERWSIFVRFPERDTVSWKHTWLFYSRTGFHETWDGAKHFNTQLSAQTECERIHKEHPDRILAMVPNGVYEDWLNSRKPGSIEGFDFVPHTIRFIDGKAYYGTIVDKDVYKGLSGLIAHAEKYPLHLRIAAWIYVRGVNTIEKTGYFWRDQGSFGPMQNAVENSLRDLILGFREFDDELRNLVYAMPDTYNAARLTDTCK